MKNTLLLLFCCTFLNKTYTQSFGYNFPGDFDSSPFAFVKKANGDFLIAGSTGGPSHSYSDDFIGSKGYILDWNAETGLSNSIKLEIFGGTMLYDAVELANGNIIATGWENHCSNPLTTLIYVKCFDPGGNLLWTQYTDTIPKNPGFVNFSKFKLAICPNNGKVAQIFNADTRGTLNLLNTGDGKLLFKYIRDNYKGLALNPVNNKLVLIQSSSIIQVNTDNNTILTTNITFPTWWAHYSDLLVDPAGTIWAISSSYGYVTKWTLNGQPVTSSVSGLGSGTHCAIYGSGFVTYIENGIGNEIRFFDANFQVQSISKIPNLANFIVVKMYLDTSTIFLVGYEEHGPGAGKYANEPQEANSNLLIRRFGFNGAPQETEAPDIAIMGLEVEVPPVFTKLSGVSAWTITGGKYVLTLRNNGNVPINTVHILSSNIGDLDSNSICNLYGKNHYSIYLQNINLAPGEEVGITIDTLNIVYAFGYVAEPWTLCFSTAAPNQQRDVDYNNDYACLKFFDAVATEAPIENTAGFRIFPNPASTSIQIVLSAASENQEAYRILSSEGQLLQQGTIPIGATQFSAGIEEIPSGLYFVETGGVFGRFIKL